MEVIPTAAAVSVCVYTLPLLFLSYTNENYCSQASTADPAPLDPKHYQSQSPIFTGQDFFSHLSFYFIQIKARLNH